jgi:glutamate synthase (NADPH/NADH) small chain
VDGSVRGIELERTRQDPGGPLVGTGEHYTLAADMVFRAIGQKLLHGGLGQGEAPDIEGGKVRVDEERRTSIVGLWAGGDCTATGEDLTVRAVEDGKVAALSIHRWLSV